MSRRSVREESLDFEVQDHLDRLVAENVEAGMTPQAARLAASRTFGRTLIAKEDARAVWGRLWIERLGQDLRYGVRMLVRNPGFAAIAVLSIGIGVGVNAAIFSFADGILMRPLAVPDRASLVTIGSTSGLSNLGSALTASYPEYEEIRDRTRSFDGIAAWNEIPVGWAASHDQTPRVRYGMTVSGNFFDVLRLPPALGRSFRPEEDRVPDRDAVVVLAHRTWTIGFGSDPSVVGRTVWLNGREFTVIGVANQQFTGIGLSGAEFFVPMVMQGALGITGQPRTTRSLRNLAMKARLREGVSLSEARAELATVGANIAREHPEIRENRALSVRTELQNRIQQDLVDAVLVAMLAVLSLSVLLVACANVAGLLTSRAPARAREIAMRLSIGASRTRVVRQLVTESLLIASLGGLVGLGLGALGAQLFNRIQVPVDQLVNLHFEMDRRTVAVSFIITVLSAVLFGLGPAVRAARTSLTAVMKARDADRVGRLRRWTQGALVIGQVALAVLLLVVAMATYRGYGRELASGPGFRTDRLLLTSIDTSLSGYDIAKSTTFYTALMDRVRSLPGVRSATLASGMPMGFSFDGAPVFPEGYVPANGEAADGIGNARVDEMYFATMGIPIVEGRAFRVDDDTEAPRVAVINERMAKHFWPGRSAVGARFRLATADGPWVEVIGVAKNSKYVWLTEPPLDFLYLPLRQRWRARLMLITEGPDSGSLAAPVRDAVHALDPAMPIGGVRTMEEYFQMRVVGLGSVMLQVIGSMGVMALGLAIVGLYGLVAYAASRRTREIGIRMAIGADRGSVVRLVLRQGLTLAMIGLVIGLPIGLAAQRLLSGVFPAQQQFDLLPLAIVVPLLLGVTFVASYLPARHAAHVDALRALNAE